MRLDFKSDQYDLCRGHQTQRRSDPLFVGRTFPLAMIGSRATSNPSVMLFVVFGFTTRIGSGIVVVVVAVIAGRRRKRARGETSWANERRVRRGLLALLQG